MKTDMTLFEDYRIRRVYRVGNLVVFGASNVSQSRKGNLAETWP